MTHLLTPGEFALRMGVSVRRVNQWRSQGRIKYKKIGHTYYYTEAEVERFTPIIEEARKKKGVARDV